MKAKNRVHTKITQVKRNVKSTVINISATKF